MNKILVIGGSGALGKQLARDLSLSDLEVISTHYSHPTQTSIQLDITKQEQVEQLIRKINPDTIILSSAMTNVAKCESNPEKASNINVNGTKNVVDNAYGKKVVFLSTDMVFNGTYNPHTEQDTPNPVNTYGTTKTQAEQLVRQHPNHLICRTARLYGKQTGKLLNFYLDNLSQESPIKVPQGNKGNFTYIPDLSQAIKTLLTRQEVGTFHLAGPAYTLPQTAYEICDYLGISRDLVELVDKDYFNKLQNVNRASVVLSTQKAQSHRIRFRDIKQGLEEILPKKIKTMQNK